MNKAKIKSIKKVKIGYSTYKIEYKRKPKEKNKLLAGRIEYAKYRITIAKNFNEEYNIQVLMHEITHGLLYSIGQVKLGGDEVLVEGLSQQLVGFIRDNKDLIKIIMDEKE